MNSRRLLFLQDFCVCQQYNEDVQAEVMASQCQWFIFESSNNTGLTLPMVYI
jgi:hypothetical protein